MKTVLITGGNSGIGYETAKLFREHGYNVTITGRNKDKLHVAAKELGVNYIVADLSNISALQKIASYYETGIDALVLNAGIAKFNPIEDSTIEKYNEIMDINVRGTYFLIKYLLPQLKIKESSICCVSSAVVNNGLKNASLYALSKGAIDSVIKSLAIELAPNIRINAISPGAVRTPILDKYGLSKEELEKRILDFEQNIPLKRYAVPSEVAQTILNQIEATYVTGAIWDVGGGIHSL